MSGELRQHTRTSASMRTCVQSRSFVCTSAFMGMFMDYIRPKKQSLWFLVSRHVTSDLSICIFTFLFFVGMKWCPIAAKIAGSMGILPSCVLYHVINHFFHIGIWTFAWFMRPLLATILCVWVIWSNSNNRVYMYMYLTGWQKKNYQ